ncbi:MAG TPA: DUF5715 family protein [Methylomirabilota bacterium]|jgi:hypothetical protein|nr:DUF5715 family protein [Methylomirabilota bacterium]
MIRAWIAGLAALLGLGLPLGPPGRSAEAAVWCHEVRRGEALTAIARRAGTSVEQLRRQNGLRRGESVRAGDIIALPALTRLRSGRLPLDSSPLPASPGNLYRENAAANRQRLSRLRTREHLDRFVRAGLLVPVAAERRGVHASGVPAWRRVARPWTRLFLHQVGHALHDLFGGARLRVTALTRTEAVQEALLVGNGNAAPAHGPRRSSHLTGASVDLSKVEHSVVERAWLRLVLARLADRGVVNSIEEFVQPHFHVMVFRRYADYARRLRSPLLVGGC